MNKFFDMMVRATDKVFDARKDEKMSIYLIGEDLAGKYGK